MTDPDDLDGCDLDFASEPTADADIDGLVLFAGLDDSTDLEAVADYWRTLAEKGGTDAS
jgi:hypothetical protein